MFPGQLVDLVDFGHGDIVGEDAAGAPTLPMDVQHDAGRVGGGFMEYGDQNLHDELHGRVVIVVKDDPVHLRLLVRHIVMNVGMLHRPIGMEGLGHIRLAGKTGCSDRAVRPG
jgi:hypothetical protein